MSKLICRALNKINQQICIFFGHDDGWDFRGVIEYREEYHRICLRCGVDRVDLG